MDLVRMRIEESIEIKKKILMDQQLLEGIQQAADILCLALRQGGKILLCGNGGSASDACHLAGELVGRFQKERKAMAAISLIGDMASITSISNDYGYESVFKRQVEGLMHPEDVLLGISTSGKSENVYQAVCKAHEIGGRTIALLGRDGGIIKAAADVAIVVPSTVTARIQEAHIMIGHILCELVEI